MASQDTRQAESPRGARSTGSGGSSRAGPLRGSRHHGPGRDRVDAAWVLDGPGFTWLRLTVDALMLAAALLAGILGARAAHVEVHGRGVLLSVFPLLTIFLLQRRGLYSRRLRIVILEGIRPLVGSISIAAMAVVAIDALTDPAARPGPLLARVWLFGLVYLGAGRILLALSQRGARRRGLLGRTALIVGAGTVGAQVARRLEEQPEYGLVPIGFLDADPAPSVEVADRRAPVLGGPDQLASVAQATGARHVILAFVGQSDNRMVPLVRECEELGLEVSLVPRLFETINERVKLEHLGGLPLLGLRSIDPRGVEFALKHVVDRLSALAGIVALGPLLLALALAVRLSSPGPILFRQRRVGRDGQVFDLLKFRSMREQVEDDEFLPSGGAAPGGVEGTDRRTPIGRWLRRSSLDELPQLFNVLRGEMSLVGPRPERPEYVELFRQNVARYSERHRVKSGITGWAQVHGFRGQTSLSDRVEWDNYYIENWTLWLDVKVLLLTISAVLRAPDDP